MLTGEELLQPVGLVHERGGREAPRHPQAHPRAQAAAALARRELQPAARVLARFERGNVVALTTSLGLLDLRLRTEYPARTSRVEASCSCCLQYL